MADSVPLRIPKLTLATTEATLVEWLVEDGTAVGDGQPIYVVETDKVETEVPSVAAGVVRLAGEPGTVYPVGAEIGRIEVEGQAL